MIPNQDQSRAIEGSGKEDRWEPIGNPAWPFEVPDWCTDTHVDMMLGWANSPHILLRVDENKLPAWKPWQRNVLPADRWSRGSRVRWMRESSCGSLREQFWHAGLLIQREDGSWETTKQEGFGGRTFTLDDVEGFGIVHLRGPWFGGMTQGWQEMHMVNQAKAAKRVQINNRWSRWRPGKRWPQSGATFGMYIREDVLHRCVARYEPHLAWARTFEHWHGKDFGGRIEPYQPEWGVPKRFRTKEQEANDPPLQY